VPVFVRSNFSGLFSNTIVCCCRYIHDLVGLGAKHKGDASSHLTVCLAFVVSWIGLAITRAVFRVLTIESFGSDWVVGIEP
jgi:hypothetical protein